MLVCTFLDKCLSNSYGNNRVYNSSFFSLKSKERFLLFLSSEPSIRGGPRFIFDSIVLLLFNFTHSSYFFLRLGLNFLNFLTAILVPWTELYFPMSYCSLSANLMFSRFLFKLFWTEDTAARYSICPKDASPCVTIISAFWCATKRQIRYYDIFHLKMLIATINFVLMKKAHLVV